MGLFSKIKKAVKGALKLTTKVTGVDWLGRKVGGALQNALGIGAMKDMAQSQQDQIRMNAEAAKLNTLNEINNVAQFDESGGGATISSDTRRKKRSAGAYASGIGLRS